MANGSVIGVVCEYNPFHNGHEYHLEMSRNQLGGDCPVICVMSGDFVQRGEPALFSKFARAEAACRCGADLVVELPLPWVLSSAEGFASGAAALLAALGATHISFGSEAGEIEPLSTLAETLLDADINELIKVKMGEDATITYPAARQKVLEGRVGELAFQLSMPNNILAVEYIKAIKKQGLALTPMTVQRYGSSHDATGGATGSRSGMELRKMYECALPVSQFIPPEAAAIYNNERDFGRGPVTRDRLESAILSRLRVYDEAYYESLPDSSDGLGRRIFKSTREEPCLDSVYAAAKTKRYTLSRIRRVCMCAALGITAEMSQGMPQYARVLAANKRGCELLHSAGEGSVKIISKPASARELPPSAYKVFAGGAYAHDLYVLGYTSVSERRGGEDWKNSPKIMNNL